MLSLVVALSIALVVTLAAVVVLAWAVRQGLCKARETDQALRTERAARRRLIQQLGRAISNPVNAILGLASELSRNRQEMSPETRQDLGALMAGGQEILLTARNLLTRHALETGSLYFSESRVSMSRLLEDLKELPVFATAGKGCHLESIQEVGSPDVVMADEAMLALILTNVLCVCTDVMDEGVVTLTVAASANQPDLTVTVMDAGRVPGEGEERNLFDPFSTKAYLGGYSEAASGMGLPIAKEVASLWGGELIHEVHPNSGNLFTLRLPLKVQSAYQGPASGRSQVVVAFDDLYVVHRKEVGPRRLLVAEDQRGNRRFLQTVLNRAGHEVDVVGDGDEALRRIEEGHYDIVVVDLRLPGISGLDVMRLAALYGPVRRDLRFIVLTGERSESVRHACEIAGADCFLVKPVSTKRLLAAICEVCDTVSVDRSLRDGTGESDRKALGSVETNIDVSQVREVMRDAVSYCQDILLACQSGDHDKILQRLHAIAGIGRLLGASALVKEAEAMAGVPPESIMVDPEASFGRVDSAVAEAIQSLAGNLPPS